MYSPEQWPALAEELVAFDQQIHSDVNIKIRRSDGPVVKRSIVAPSESFRTPVGSAIDPIQHRADVLVAITCGDAADAGSTTTKDVFDAVLQASIVSPFCEPFGWS
jgi:hypothetical protein